MNKDNILIVYGHENLYASIGKGSDLLAYYIHFVIDSDGIIRDKDFILKLYDHILTDEQKTIFSECNLIGPFHIYGELEEFCLKISDYYKRRNVRILSVADYNEILVDIHTKNEFSESLFNHSTLIERPDDSDKKSFFSNLFS